MKEFRDKVAVITGTASGIGLALAERCAQEGMKIVMADIDEDALVIAEKNIKATGAPTLAVITDVSKARDVEALAAKTLDAFGTVHLLCNNAGVGAGFTVWGNTLNYWQWVLGVNLWGVIYGIHFFVPIMLKQDTECHIVNTASAAGLYTSNISAYTISKHGVVALSETLFRELELEGRKVGVSVLCSGLIRTNIVEAERHRPKVLQNEPGVDGLDITDPKIQYLKQIVENGMPLQQVADIVFSSIRDKKFYILQNIEIFKPLIKARMEDVLQERNPTNVK